MEKLDDWEEDLLRRYPPPGESPDGFRDYAAAKPHVREFYRTNHREQTFDFVQAKQADYLPRQRARMGIWQALEFLNTLVDESDPDIDLPQIEHCLQTAEAIRASGKPDWFVLVGLIHDLGKVLCLWGEPQWAVVGDTFPVGCPYSDRVVFPEFFAANPDLQRAEFQRAPTGVYEPGCGLGRVHMSWGHDEYLYHVVRDYLPEPGLYMIRYHSFYAAHREGAYAELFDERDRANFPWVREFNPFDLYTKRTERMNIEALRPYYEDLIARYFPAEVAW